MTDEINLVALPTELVPLWRLSAFSSLGTHRAMDSVSAPAGA